MSTFNRLLKRSFDLIAAVLGSIVLLPMGVAIALLVKLTSPGPALFMQARIGRRGNLFTCVKFRTMTVGADRHGSITSATDSRITPVGRILRQLKLDELPQLLNIVIGRMSFVGPRPDVVGYADQLAGDDRRILELAPGITGPATLYFRHEEELLAKVDNPKQYNDTVIWPKKVAMNLEYLDNWSFWKDLGFILVTVVPMVNKLLGICPESPRDP